MKIQLVRRSSHGHCFILDRVFLSNVELSLKAKGLLALLFSLEGDWGSMEILEAKSRDGRESIRSAAKELKELGYLNWTTVRGKDGKLKGQRWEVFDIPPKKKRQKPKDGRTGFVVPVEGRVFENCSRSSHSKSDSHSRDSRSKRVNCSGKEVPAANTAYSFFKNEDENSKNPNSIFLNKLIDELENFLRKSRKIHTRVSRKAWYENFRLLLNDLDGDAKRLTSAMNLFTTLPINRYKPIVNSAKSFREKYLSIENWIESQGPVKLVSSIKIIDDDGDEDEELPDQ